jgi:hypothetical protein
VRACPTCHFLQIDGVTEPPRGGVRRQDQLERFSAKREHNQHTKVQYHIINLSRSYYNLGLCISDTTGGLKPKLRFRR